MLPFLLLKRRRIKHVKPCINVRPKMETEKKMNK
jgi:hypothetical protein